MRVRIRWMIRRDMSETLAIESASSDYPWSEDDFLRVLRRRNVIGMVVEDIGRANRVVGFVVYELDTPPTTIRVLNMAVDPAVRRRGVGRAIVAKLVGKLDSGRRTRIDLSARETNMGGLAFLKAVGFRAEGVARGHFEDTGEDAYGMVYRIAGAEGPEEEGCPEEVAGRG